MKNLFINPNIKKGDIVIFLIIGLVILLSTIGFYQQPGEAKVLKIYREGEEYASFSLSQPYARTISVPVKEGVRSGYNALRMEDGAVTIVESSCPNKDCMRMGSISQAGDVLICLPHKLVLRLEGGEAVDAVSY